MKTPQERKIEKQGDIEFLKNLKDLVNLGRDKNDLCTLINQRITKLAQLDKEIEQGEGKENISKSFAQKISNQKDIDPEIAQHLTPEFFSELAKADSDKRKSAEDYCCEWHNKKYGVGKELGDWTPEDVMEFAESYASQQSEVPTEDDIVKWIKNTYSEQVIHENKYFLSEMIMDFIKAMRGGKIGK